MMWVSAHRTCVLWIYDSRIANKKAKMYKTLNIHYVMTRCSYERLNFLVNIRRALYI